MARENATKGVRSRRQQMSGKMSAQTQYKHKQTHREMGATDTEEDDVNAVNLIFVQAKICTDRASR
jgi:hypothetical protein